MQAIVWSPLFDRSRPIEAGSLSFGGIFIFVAVNVTLFIYNYKKNADLWTLGALFLNAFLVLAGGFSVLYWSYGSTVNFTVSLSRLDAVYFMLGTLTTAGTGNISAISEASRYVQSLQMFLDLALMVFAAGLLIARFTTSRESRPSDGGESAG